MGCPRSDTHLHRTPLDLCTQDWPRSTVSPCVAGQQGSGLVTDGTQNFIAETHSKIFIHFPQAVHQKTQTLHGKRSNLINLMAVQIGVTISSILKQWHSGTHGHWRKGQCS